MSKPRVFAAKKILTIDPDCPQATHVAVRDGRILALGGPDCADPWGGGEADDRLADAVLMPGLIEGHAHMMAGGVWAHSYLGYHDRTDPDGRLFPGLDNIEAVLDRLAVAEADLPPGQALLGWGFDPIFLPTERLNRHHLDRISRDRPVVVVYSNFHLLCANTAALRLAGYDGDTDIEGVVMGADGEPLGELQEMAAMFPLLRRVGASFSDFSQSEASLRAYARVAVRAGVTTITDLYSSATEEDVDRMLAISGEEDFPVRIVPTLAAEGDPASAVAKALAYRARSTDRLRFAAVKLMTDGSIQGYTARVNWPGYVTGHQNGIWVTAPETIAAYADAFQAAGIQMNIHVNGDEAADVALDALEAAARRHPWPGARHILQHCQMMGRAQFRRARELGVACNIFSNHIWYFGDIHAARTLGPDRAARMDAARSALDEGVEVAIHSDAPVTPLGPLFTAWCAVNRTTMSGRVLGPSQRITVGEALYAITMGAARTLKLDAEIGSITPGKRADFAVLGDDPTSVAPEALRDIPVRGTVLGGRLHLP